MFTALFGMTAFILMWIGGIRCNFLKFTAVSEVEDPVTMELLDFAYRMLHKI